MVGNSFVAMRSNPGKSEPYESVNFLLMNNFVQFLKKTENETNQNPVMDVVPFETNATRSSIASECISRSKSIKKTDSRNKSPYNSKHLPRRNSSTYYKPSNVKNSAFVHKGRQQTRKIESHGNDYRRKSIDCPYAVRTQSTKVYDLDNDHKLILEESNNLESSRNNHHRELNGSENNTLPPLTNHFNSLSIQPKKYLLQNPKERRRSLSGQSTTLSSNEKLSLKNHKSASIDYSSMMKTDSRSSSFSSARYSQANGNFGTSSSDAQAKTNSAQSANSAYRRKQESFHRSATMSDMLEASKRNSANTLSPENALRSDGRSKRGMRANNVYSPISVASAEKPRFSSKPNFSKRRSSLPTNYLGISNLTAETSRSREFFEAMDELKKNPTPKKLGKVERESACLLTTREGLHIIEEIHPEASFDAGQKTVKEVNGIQGANDQADTQLTFGKSERSQTPSQSNQNTEAALLSSNRTNAENNEGQYKNDPKKSSFFDVPEDPASSKKIFSRLENKKHISNNEQNQHFVVEGDSNELEVEDHCLLLKAASAHEENYIDNSVVFKDDDDLCDGDFHEKRLILWLMDASTGEDAEVITRITPPPSPDLSTRESAIRVVYGEDSSNR